MMVITVDLDKRSYPIIIGHRLLGTAGEQLKSLLKGHQILIVTDEQVGALYLETLAKSLAEQKFEVASVVIPAGETSKSWAMAEKILTDLLTRQFHRDCAVIALGGGVVGDLAGFVASIYQRGVDFVQIPTSLLAQVDSSVGGKVAVNHALGKNMIGAFYQPKAVLIDLTALDTLEEAHWRNGMAEVIKYGVISDDKFFTFLKDNQQAIKARQGEAITEMIARCCQIKASVVAEDEQDKGSRAKLNFGHTIGHGLEIASHFRYLHGEAVAIGMVLAGELAQRRQICGSQTVEALKEILLAYQLPIAFADDVDIELVLKGMALDKKVTDGAWVFILPKMIGQVEIVKGIAPEEVRALLESGVK